MNTIKTSGKEYDLYWNCGRVEGSSKNMETRVHGSGGGSTGYGTVSNVNITSTTTVHDQFFIVDKSGKESSYQLQNFNIACREGNELSVIWAIKKGSKTGPYIAVHNRSTSNTFFQDTELKKIFRYPVLYPLIAMIVLFMLAGSIGYGTAFFLVFALWIAWFVHGSMGANKFKKETDFNQFT